MFSHLKPANLMKPSPGELLNGGRVLHYCNIKHLQ